MYLFFFLGFHMQVISYDIYLSLSDLLHSVWLSLGPSMLLQMAFFVVSFCGRVALHCMFFHQWPFRVLSHPDCCESCCNEHGVHCGFFVCLLLFVLIKVQSDWGCILNASQLGSSRSMLNHTGSVCPSHSWTHRTKPVSRYVRPRFSAKVILVFPPVPTLETVVL